MSLVRAWMRALSGASGAALLVPGGVFAAMVLLALAGSFGQLGQLGQAFAGPPSPSAVQAVVAPVRPGGRATLLPITSAGAAALVSPAGLGVVTTGGTPGRSTGPTPVGQPTPTPGRPGPPVPVTPRCGSACPPPPPGPKPTIVDQVVSVGTSITSKLPGPIGQLATQALKQVGVVGQLDSTLSKLR
jgi:hypothetical protein